MKIRTKYLKKFEGKKVFILGDEAVAWGAVFAGCNFFGAYPITPATEIAETIAKLLPCVDGNFIQMEDEIASIGAIIGASWAGGKSMTATSGPGFSLMQENLGYAAMTETPCVIVDVQRSGPSTGQATKPAQGDVMQARWGTHGDHEIIALSPYSIEECFYLTIDAFNLSEKYRTPVILLLDGLVGHIREPFVFPDPDSIKITPRKLGKPGDLSFGGETVPPMLEIGSGGCVHITGSTHHENGLRDVETKAVHENLVYRICDKIKNDTNELTRVDEILDGDYKSLVISYGCIARPAKGAVLKAREEGKDIGYIRLINIWPFPDEYIRKAAEKCEKIYVPEMNLGQVNREIERLVSCPVVPVSKIGGIGHSIDEIYEAII